MAVKRNHRWPRAGRSRELRGSWICLAGRSADLPSDRFPPSQVGPSRIGPVPHARIRSGAVVCRSHSSAPLRLGAGYPRHSRSAAAIGRVPPRRRSELRACFDCLFRRHTGFATLDRLLQRLHANKAELLMVLDRPEIPLHTNGSENDLRCQVTKRRINGGTKSDIGRDCRDAFLALAKTCNKLRIALWNYLGARLAAPDTSPAPLPARSRPLPRPPRLT